jgi:1,4-dihydroxy-2-naphthoate octaprenyltransferase
MGLTVWLRETRAPFLVAVILPTIMGGFIAASRSWADFDIPLFIVTLVGVTFIHVGANVANDYFDYRSKADVYVRPEEKTPFSGGSGLLVDGSLSPKKTLAFALLFLGMGSALGLYIVWALGGDGWVILLIGLLGLASGFFYTAPPFKFVHRGLGEFFIWLSFGPLTVFGTYFVQVRTFDLEPIIAAVPVGLLVSAILYINEFPDARPDAKAGKRHLVVRMGRKRAVKGYKALVAGVYASVLAGVVVDFIGLLDALPLWTLLTFLTGPIALGNIRHLKRFYRHPQALIPANAGTIKLFAMFTLLMCIAYLLTTISW